MGVNEDALRRVRQVHGNGVMVVRRTDRGDKAGRAAGDAGRLMEADAIVADDPALALASRRGRLCTAAAGGSAYGRRGGGACRVEGDRGARGAGGGRGALSGIRRCARRCGRRHRSSIGGCCYEVGSELVDAFAAAGHERYLIDRWFRAPPHPRGRHALFGVDGPAPRGVDGSAWSGVERPVPSEVEGGRLRLDIGAANRDQLILAGVPEKSIHIAGLCTAMNLELLTSYRMEKNDAGRIAGIIRARG